MTATKAVLIRRDALSHVMGCEARWAGKPDQTIFSTRTDAHNAGWRYRGGRDWCPDHAAAPLRRGSK